MNDERRSVPIVSGGPPVGRLRRLAAPVGVLALAAGVVTYVGAVDPNEPGHYPTCPFLYLTGLQCPGCGSLRTVHALAHGDVGTALGLNALTVAMVPVLLFFWGRWALARARNRPSRKRAGSPWAIWGLFAVVIVFWVVRNLPFGAFLAP